MYTPLTNSAARKKAQRRKQRALYRAQRRAARSARNPNGRHTHLGLENLEDRAAPGSLLPFWGALLPGLPTALTAHPDTLDNSSTSSSDDRAEPRIKSPHSWTGEFDTTSRQANPKSQQGAARRDASTRPGFFHFDVSQDSSFQTQHGQLSQWLASALSTRLDAFSDSETDLTSEHTDDRLLTARPQPILGGGASGGGGISGPSGGGGGGGAGGGGGSVPSTSFTNSTAPNYLPSLSADESGSSEVVTSQEDVPDATSTASSTTTSSSTADETTEPSAESTPAQRETVVLGFDGGLDQWSTFAEGGSAGSSGTVSAGSAVLTEGDSFVVGLEQSFSVPEINPVLQFTYTDLEFDKTDSHFINDAFEASLVDADGHPLVHTIGIGHDAFFNITEDEPVALGSATELTPGTINTVTVELSDVPVGTAATLQFRLVNNDSDTTTTVRILDVFLPGSEDAPPTVSVQLANDTSPVGEELGPLADDLLTNDSRVAGTVSDDQGITKLEASIDGGAFVEITSLLVGNSFEYDPGTLAPGSHSITLRVTDTGGQTGEATLDFEINHLPVANAGDNRTIEEGQSLLLDGSASTDAEGIYSYQWTFGDGSVSDGINASQTYDEDGIYTASLTVVDTAGSTDTDTIQIEVLNLPVTITPVANVTVGEGREVEFSTSFADPGVLDTHTATIDWDDGTITDPANLEEQDGAGTVSGSHTYADNGSYQVTVTITDDEGAEATTNFTVVVENEQPAVVVSPTTQSTQYSDAITPIVISATDVADDTVSIVTTYQVDGGVVQLELPKGLTLSGSGGTGAGNWTITGIADVAPGIYTIDLAVSDEDGGTTHVAVTLTVAQEDAAVVYSGIQLVSTPSINDSQATVALRATIKDSSQVDDTDSLPGDIRNATVSFVLRETGEVLAAGLPVTLLDDTDLTVGIAAFDWAVDLGNADADSFTIGVIVDGYYTRNSAADDTVITVAKPQPNSITGGGYLVNEASAGTYAGDFGLRTNYGFNVKFNKTLKNLQGHVNVIVRQDDHVYQIKSNKMESLQLDAHVDHAVFTGKANIRDVTDPENPLSLAGNLELEMTVTDRGEPGTHDSISIAAWRQDELVFSSRFDGDQTIQQLTDGGNIQVRRENEPVVSPDVAATKFFVADAVVDEVFRYGPDGAQTGSYSLPAAAGDARGATSDVTGHTVWVVDATGAVSVQGPDGELRGQWTPLGITAAEGIATDGVDVWIVDGATDYVRLYAGAALFTSGLVASSGGFPLHADNQNPSGLATDGSRVWVTDDQTGEVFVYGMDGSFAGRWQLDTENSDPSGITNDPSGESHDLWVVDRADGLIYAYAEGASLSAGSATAVPLALATANSQPEGIADPPDSLGTEFWLAFPPNNTGLTQLDLFIASEANTEGTVEIPGIGFADNFTVAANTVTTVSLPFDAQLLTSTESVQTKGIHVTSNDEVSVYGLNRRTASTDGYLGLPSDVLGFDHIVLTYEQGLNGSSYGSEFAIVGSVDDTTVAVTPPIDVGGHVAGSTYEISLNEGEVYQLISSHSGDDLSGTMITSDQPVAVFAGNKCTTVPFGILYCDHLIEQLPPVSTWGQNFVTMPLATRQNGDAFRFLAAEDDTQININGTIVTLDRGDFHEQRIEEPAHIVSDKPIMVAQYAHSEIFDQDEDNDGDPFMMVVPPYEQFLTEYVVSTPAAGIDINYVNIVVPSAAVGMVEVDGTAVSSSSYTKIAGSPFYGVQIPIVIGTHRLTSPLPFGAVVYGFDTQESYGYAAGLTLSPIAEVEDLEVSASADTIQVGSDVLITAVVRDEGQNPIEGVRVDFVVSGTNEEVGFSYTDANGIAAFHYAGTLPGTDSVTANLGAISDSLSIAWTIGPTISISTPDEATQVVAGTTMLVSGQATTAAPGTSISHVTANGVPVEVLDASGNFFTRVDILPGTNSFELVAYDTLGQSVSTTLEITGSQLPSDEIDFGLFSDVTASLEGEYGRTSFQADSSALYTDLSIKNAGQYPVQTPLLVGIKNISDPTVRVSGFDGLTPDGVPYFDFSALIAGNTLAPDAATEARTISFRNPNRAQFTYDLVFLGQLNQAPSITSVPVVEALVGRAYTYDVDAADPDGDPISYALVAGPASMTIDSESGVINWSPVLPDIGTHDVVVRVVDGFGGVSEQRFVLSAVEPPPNRPPRFTSTPVVDATAGSLYGYDADATDPDSDTLVYSLVTAPEGMQIDATTGQIEWAPAIPLGTYEIVVEANDGQGGAARQSFVLNVQEDPGNNPPVFISDPVIHFQINLAYQYASSAIDPDGDTVTYSLVEAPDGALIDEQTGEISWLPPAVGEYQFLVRAEDGRGGFDEQSFTVEIVGPGTAEIRGQKFEDADGDGLQGVDELGLADWTIYLDQNNNSQRDPGERFTTTNENGDYEFTGLAARSYTVREEQQAGWVQTTPGDGFHSVTLIAGETFTGADFGNQFVGDQPNTAPTITSTAPTTAKSGQVYRYHATATDPENDPVEFDLALKPVGMTVNSATGTIVWTPQANQVGTHDVILRVRDGRGGFDLQAFQIAVAPANTPPIITSTPPGPASVDLPYEYRLRAQDADADVLQFQLETAPAGMSIDSATGSLKWTPTTAAIGLNPVTVVVSDGRGGQARQSFDLEVVTATPNLPPEIDSTPRTNIQIGRQYRYVVSATDPNGDPLSYHLDNAPNGMTMDEEGLVSWSPTADQIGTHNVSIRVDDGRGGTTTQDYMVTVSVEFQNSAPTITSNPPLAATLGKLYQYDTLATDPDGDPLYWSLESGPAGMSLDATTGAVRWTPTSGQLGLQNVVIRVVDGQGGSTKQSFTITVRSVNLPPAILSIPPTLASASEVYTYPLAATDAEGDSLTFSVVGPARMVIDPNTGLVSWTPAGSDEGVHTVEVSVSDGVATATQIYDLQVSSTAANNPPVLTSTPTLLAAVGELYEYQLSATDPEGDAITYHLIEGPTGMQIGAGGLVQWIPAAGQVGDFTVVVAATDVLGAQTRQEFTISSDENLPPVITSSPVVNLLSGNTYHYDVIANDPNGDPLTYWLAAGPAGMTIDSLGRIEWPTQPAIVANYTVTVLVWDGRGGIAEQTFELDVIRDSTALWADILISPNPVEVGKAALIDVQASDDVGLASVTLTVGGTAVPLDANLAAFVTLDTPGDYLVEAIATDSTGNRGIATTTLFVEEASSHDAEAPVVAIDNIQDGDIITALTDVIGTADDTNLESYTLSVAPLGGEFVELFHSTSPVTSGVLGTFDPSTLANDTYILRLEATDGTFISRVDRQISVTGDLKLGNFTLSFTDLTVPVAGIPISVTRTYDSFDAARDGQVGYGWRLEFRDVNLRTSVVPTGLEDQGVYGAFKQGTRVFLTLPGGRREGFTFEPQFEEGYAALLGLVSPFFTPDPGVTSRLSVPEALLTFNSDGSLGLGSIPYNPLNPAWVGLLRLTTEDGIDYIIDGPTGKIESIIDNNGNVLLFSDDGITSTSGGVTVDFERDPRGRISAVVDPGGNRIEYRYDIAGDLVAVTDREQHTTEFHYDEPSRAHFLTEVVDPLGRTGVRTEYDDQGRLLRMIDAGDESIGFAYDPDNSTVTVTDQLGNPTTYEYDLWGNVVTEIDAEGGITRRTYDDPNNPTLETSVTDPAGNTTHFAYDQRGNVVMETDPLGNVTRTSYTSFNTNSFEIALKNLGTLAGTGGEAAIALLDQPSPLPFSVPTTVTDPLGNTTTNTYDIGGNLLTTVDPDGLATTINYIPSGLSGYSSGLPSELSLGDNTTTFAYDSVGNVITQTDAAGTIRSFTYDANGNQLTETVEFTTSAGTSTVDTATEYDNENRVTKVTTKEDGVILSSTETVYDAVGNREFQIDLVDPLTGEKRFTQFVYDDRGLLTKTIFPDDDDAQFVGVPDPNDPTRFNNPFTETRYDAAGNVIAEIDELGRETRFAYDRVGRQTKTISPDGDADPANNPFTETVYDLAGRVIAEIDERGNWTEFVLDAAGNVVETILPDDNDLPFDGTRSVDLPSRQNNPRIVDTYDAAGHRVSTTDPLGNTTKFVYSASGLPVETILPDNSPGDDTDNLRTMSEFDDNRQLVARTDSADTTTRYEYDALGRLTAVLQDLSGDVVRTKYEYDELGNLVVQRDANQHETRYEYDGLGRRTKTILPDDSPEDLSDNLFSTTVYDALGRVESTTDFNGATILFEYDARDRLTKQDFPTGTDTTFTYYDNGLRQSVTDERGTTFYEYDERNRLLRRTEPDGSTIEYTYDAAGNRTAVITTVLDNAPRTTTYTFDSQNRQQTVLDSEGGLTTYFYDLAGRLERTELPNGTYELRTYDAMSRLLAVESFGADDSLLAGFQYRLDVAGDRTQIIEETPDSTRVVDYVYDNLSRLTKETMYEDVVDSMDLAGETIDRTIEYVYDDVGNRLSRDDSAEGLTEYDYDAMDRLTLETLAGDATHYEYDHNGNTLRKVNDATDDVLTEYTWDFENRLVAVDTDGDGIDDVSYQYDADGMRVSTATAGDLVRYLLDKNRPYAQVLEEYTPGGIIEVSNVHGLDLISQNLQGVKSFFHVDGLGSTRALSEALGIVTDRYIYDAFGRTIGGFGATENGILFAGEARDGLTGLDYLRARWMDAGAGRFVSRDPFAPEQFVPATLHRYTYVDGNPLNRIDPSGNTFLVELLESVSIRSTLRSATLVGRKVCSGDDLVWKELANTIAAGLAFSMMAIAANQGYLPQAGFAFGYKAPFKNKDSLFQGLYYEVIGGTTSVVVELGRGEFKYSRDSRGVKTLGGVFSAQVKFEPCGVELASAAWEVGGQIQLNKPLLPTQTITSEIEATFFDSIKLSYNLRGL